MLSVVYSLDIIPSPSIVHESKYLLHLRPSLPTSVLPPSQEILPQTDRIPPIVLTIHPLSLQPSSTPLFEQISTSNRNQFSLAQPLPPITTLLIPSRTSSENADISKADGDSTPFHESML